MEHARLMAEVGGVIGVWPSGFSEGGVDEVWDDYADLPAVADLLLEQGFSPDEAARILGGNYVRVFRQVAAARR